MKRMLVIKREARQKLKPAYWSALLVCVVSFLIYNYVPNIGAIGFDISIPFTLPNILRILIATESLILQLLLILAVSIILYIFITGPLTVGRARYFLHGIDGDWNIRYLLSPFLTRDYFQIVRTMAMRYLIICIAPVVAGILFLLLYIRVDSIWAILIICSPVVICSIVVYYRHRLTPYLLAEEPKMKFYETKIKHNRIDSDDKLVGLFVVDFSFWTWYVFGATLFFIGQFFFMPYHETVIALRYREFFPRKQDEGESTKKADLPNDENLGQHKGSTLSANGATKVMFCIFLSVAILTGVFQSAIASAYDETEIIVTTEEELRDAIHENKSPIRIDTSIYLTRAINIAQEHNIVLRGTGTLYAAATRDVVGHHNLLRHFVIHSGGRLTLQEDLRLTRASDIEYGGGIHIHDSFGDEQFIMEGGRIEYNIAYRGGAVNVEGGHFRMYGGVIRGNHAGAAGGGVHVSNSRGVILFTMNGGEISENTSLNGGGVHLLSNAHFAMYNGLITENTAQDSGGGIGLFIASSASIMGGEISHNRAGRHGGAIGRSNQQDGYENITTGSQVRFYGNSIDGRLTRHGTNRMSSSIRYNAGRTEFPQIQWHGENSRPGTHLINNYDIAFAGWWMPAQWQFNLMLAAIVIVGKAVALLILKVRERKLESQQEVEYAE